MRRVPRLLLLLLAFFHARAWGGELVPGPDWGGEAPRLAVKRSPGGAARIDRARALSGPWTAGNNVAASAEGWVLLDWSADPSQRFYRAVADPRPVGPAGFVWIPAGTFLRGSPSSEILR